MQESDIKNKLVNILVRADDEALGNVFIEVKKILEDFERFDFNTAVVFRLCCQVIEKCCNRENVLCNATIKTIGNSCLRSQTYLTDKSTRLAAAQCINRVSKLMKNVEDKEEIFHFINSLISTIAADDEAVVTCLQETARYLRKLLDLASQTSRPVSVESYEMIVDNSLYFNHVSELPPSTRQCWALLADIPMEAWREIYLHMSNNIFTKTLSPELIANICMLGGNVVDSLMAACGFYYAPMQSMKRFDFQQLLDLTLALSDKSTGTFFYACDCRDFEFNYQRMKFTQDGVGLRGTSRRHRTSVQSQGMRERDRKGASMDRTYGQSTEEGEEIESSSQRYEPVGDTQPVKGTIDSLRDDSPRIEKRAINDRIDTKAQQTKTTADEKLAARIARFGSTKTEDGSKTKDKDNEQADESRRVKCSGPHIAETHLTEVNQITEVVYKPSRFSDAHGRTEDDTKSYDTQVWGSTETHAVHYVDSDKFANAYKDTEVINPNYRRVLCRHFIRGRCQWSDCNFSHDLSNPNQRPHCGVNATGTWDSGDKREFGEEGTGARDRPRERGEELREREKYSYDRNRTRDRECEFPPAPFLLIRNLPSDTKFEELVELMHTTGCSYIKESDVLVLNMLQSQLKNAFIDFRNIEDATKVKDMLNGQIFGGLALDVCYSSGRASRVLCVGGILALTSREITKFFVDYGTIDKVDMFPESISNDSFALVHFKDMDSSRQAIKELGFIVMIHGVNVRLRYHTVTTISSSSSSSSPTSSLSTRLGVKIDWSPKEHQMKTDADRKRRRSRSKSRERNTRGHHSNITKLGNNIDEKKKRHTSDRKRHQDRR